MIYTFVFDRFHKEDSMESSKVKDLLAFAVHGIDENTLYPTEIKDSTGKVIYTRDDLYTHAGY